VRHFCTLFDRNYLVRGLTLYRSLVQHAGPFQFWALCLDEAAYSTLSDMKLPGVRPVRLEELERSDPELLGAKANRSRVEYFFTLSPAWPRCLLREHPEIDLITYLDADLYFYSSPEPIFRELEGHSVGIHEHRFPEHLRHLDRHGVYNVGFLSFRNDETGRACLDSWRGECLEWCYDRVEDGRFGDQKYLDAWPARFGDAVRVIEHKGAGLAPWNFMNYRISLRAPVPTVDGEPLIFYHFHALKLFSHWVFDPGDRVFGEMTAEVRRWLYPRYVHELKRTTRWVRRTAPEIQMGLASIRTGADNARSIARKLLTRQAMVSLRPSWLHG
jgi:hypothetical protein